MKKRIPITHGKTERDVREASFTYQIFKGNAMRQIQQALEHTRQEGQQAPQYR